MSRTCQITGKRRHAAHNVSHSNRKSLRFQQPNLVTKRIFVPEENRTVTIRVSARALRTLNKKGLRQFLKEEGRSL
ncbi:MAG: 50S ribosomal protein L28 [Candidatus Handelsmanbacteria bacterium]|nr:50S ribosomal protein L28 [Candidatus Handelsmanbacteria bacterium]